jgi:phosphoenolpyruvate-protein phosphotransferase (PTS system enzyme I)
MVNDFTLHDLVVSKIERQHANAEKATNDAIEELYARLKNMDDDYMKERAADIKDIGTQLIAALQNRSDDKFSGLHVSIHHCSKGSVAIRYCMYE